MNQIHCKVCVGIDGAAVHVVEAIEKDYENQGEYYSVLQRADNAGDSTEFVAFMLGMIRSALKEISKTHTGTDVVINVAENVVTNERKVIIFF